MIRLGARTMARFNDETLYTLAHAARPLDQYDWGSERQVTAQNAFFNYVQQRMHPLAFAELEDFALHATTDEMINEAIRWLEEE
jgi:hypothetical protein